MVRSFQQLPRFNIGTEDKVVWLPCYQGEYSSASAREVIRARSDMVDWYKWSGLKGMFLGWLLFSG